MGDEAVTLRNNGPLPAEARINYLDNRGRLKVDFTQSLMLPKDIKEQINLGNSESYATRSLAGKSSTGKIQAYSIRDEGDDYAD